VLHENMQYEMHRFWTFMTNTSQISKEPKTFQSVMKERLRLQRTAHRPDRDAAGDAAKPGSPAPAGSKVAT